MFVAYAGTYLGHLGGTIFLLTYLLTALDHWRIVPVLWWRRAVRRMAVRDARHAWLASLIAVTRGSFTFASKANQEVQLAMGDTPHQDSSSARNLVLMCTKALHVPKS